ANEYVTEEGGLNVEEAVEAVRFIKENLIVSSATIAAFDPAFDSEGKTLAAGYKLIREIVSNNLNYTLGAG
nr:hypothetical protein [Acidobacteriota bacterium]